MQGREKGGHLEGRILIVDDDAAIRSLLALVAGRAGFTVDVVTNGEEALARLAGADYLVVLLDLMMPRLSGYEVIARLGRVEPRPAIIAVTATTQTFSDLDPRLVHSVVRKPFDIHELAIVITECARAMEERRRSAPPSASPGERRDDLRPG